MQRWTAGQIGHDEVDAGPLTVPPVAQRDRRAAAEVAAMRGQKRGVQRQQHSRLRDVEYRNLYCHTLHRTGMKTTLDLDDALLTRAKALAAQQRTSLTRLIEEGLQLRLRAQRAPAKAQPLPVYRGRGGLVPGLDATSNKAMLDAADQGD